MSKVRGFIYSVSQIPLPYKSIDVDDSRSQEIAEFVTRSRKLNLARITFTVKFHSVHKASPFTYYEEVRKWSDNCFDYNNVANSRAIYRYEEIQFFSANRLSFGSKV